MGPETVWLTGCDLGLPEVERVARGSAPVALTEEAAHRVQRGAARLADSIARGVPIYGVTTGFGALDRQGVAPAQRALLQRNLILSHAAGVGPPMAPDAVRAMMLCRANVLAQGLPAVSPRTLEALLACLNRRVTPVVPLKGSVGASGDLAPLAHMALPLLGLGEAEADGVRLPGGEALRRVGLAPITLEGRDGLALINGTEQASALGCLVAADARRLLLAATVATAAATEALNGLDSHADEWIHAVKPHPGSLRAARHLRQCLVGSRITTPAAHPTKLRDALAVRCAPQVLGPAWEALDAAAATLGREINSANDNPLLELDGERVNSNVGNFHGQSVAHALDALAAALTSVGVIAERRAARLVDEMLSDGLPAFLVAPPPGEAGCHNGFMIAQYTAAALVAECRVLAAPAAIHSVPTCANSEDHVSMAPLAAVKARAILDNVTHIVAVELLEAAQGLELRGLDRAGAASRAAHAALRAGVPAWTADRVMGPDIEAAAALVRTGALVGAVEAAVGSLDAS